MKYTDGPFGIREEMQPNSWMPLGLENDKATFFPTGSALAATWSPNWRMNMAPGWRVKPGCGERYAPWPGHQYPTDSNRRTNL